MKETLDKIGKILDELKVPSEIKTYVLTGAAMGVDGNVLVRAVAETVSAMETRKAEEKTPKPEVPSDYTETERIIAEMLWENTGVHILDSGGAYGRHWQKNRQIKDFRKTPRVRVEVWKDGEVIANVNVFHYLVAYLERTRECEILERMLYSYAESEEHQHDPWLAIMEDFAEEILVNLGYDVHPTVNTYNYENVLSQVLQYIIFENEDKTYIMLQIHNGCDVRGGYTAPRIFEVVEPDYFHIAQTELYARCNCTHVWSDDCGYHWYGERGEEGFPEYWKPVPKKPDAESWEYKLVCEKCGKDVQFDGMLEY